MSVTTVLALAAFVIGLLAFLKANSAQITIESVPTRDCDAEGHAWDKWRMLYHPQVNKYWQYRECVNCGIRQTRLS